MSDSTPEPVEPAKPIDLNLLDTVLKMSEDEVLPWEEVILPSHGLYYDKKVPDGRVQVRPMGLHAEKILATQRLAASGKSLEWLFKKCVKFPNEFDPLNLLAGDRIFLLYYLRGITHGNNYEFVVRCTNEDCGQATTDEYDLNGLRNTISRPVVELGEEPFKIVLPHLTEILRAKGHTEDFYVKVRFLRGYDMAKMLTHRNVAKRFGGKPVADSIDNTLEENLNLLIVDAMGHKDPIKIKELVQKLHAADTATIREFLRENSPGIDTTIDVKCKHCGNEMRMELPITESFFRPARSGNTRE